jgi:hypothetical protein
VRRRAPREPAVALLLGHAYFKKLWRSDGLREYAEAVKLRPALRRDALLRKNVVSALDDPTYPLARAVVRKELGPAALGELRTAARTAKSPKVQRRAAKLVAELSHPARGRRRW